MNSTQTENPPLIWIHGDSLSPDDPAARRYPGAPRVFVFDRLLLAMSELSFKRLFFLYECAGEAADEIRLGNPVEEVLEACREHGREKVAVTATHAPRFRELVSQLQRHLPVEIIPDEPLVSVPDDYLPRRFSAFWRLYGNEWQ